MVDIGSTLEFDGQRAGVVRRLWLDVAAARGATGGGEEAVRMRHGVVDGADGIATHLWGCLGCRQA